MQTVAAMFARRAITSSPLIATDRAACIALARADRNLSQQGRGLARSEQSAIEHIQVHVPPGQTVHVCSIDGNRAISALRVSPDLPPPPADREVLRELTMSIKWDGESEPSVWAPLGDFFGTAPGVNLYRALPLGMTEAGFHSRWYMPFNTNALIELTNGGTKARTVAFEIRHGHLEHPASELFRFHAKWHRDAFLELSQHHGRDIDWPILNVRGEGRFCGAHLHVWNRWTEPVPPADSWWYGIGGNKSIDWWWGEGDEKFFVDGEQFPSTFGTGSEDYIGYSWSAEPPFPLFESAFACQPYVELDGYATLCRPRRTSSGALAT